VASVFSFRVDTGSVSALLGASGRCWALSGDTGRCPSGAGRYPRLLVPDACVGLCTLPDWTLLLQCRLFIRQECNNFLCRIHLLGMYPHPKRIVYRDTSVCRSGSYQRYLSYGYEFHWLGSFFQRSSCYANRAQRFSTNAEIRYLQGANPSTRTIERPHERTTLRTNQKSP